MPVINVRPTAEMLARKRLTLDDLDALSKLPHVVAASGGIQYSNWQLGVGSVAVSYNGKKIQNTILEGDTPDVAKTYDLNVIQGRLFNESDQFRSANVVDLGYDASDDLFQGQTGGTPGHHVIEFVLAPGGIDLGQFRLAPARFNQEVSA